MSRIRQLALLAAAAYLVSRFIPRQHKEMGEAPMEEHEVMAKKHRGSAA
ncbi:hypothetical protein [Candidatus Aquicultor secundus]|nr:hypothetical protein [Candidatus Aquicultor secundus]NCO66552.1 hypothetical protein [Solirubrobacter sp.]